MTFKEFITDIKMVSGGITALAAGLAVMWAGYSHFHTDAEAATHIVAFEDYQKQQYQADKFDRIDRIQREIDRIDYQLLDTSLDQIKREYLQNKRKDLEAKIECIRRDEC